MCDSVHPTTGVGCMKPPEHPGPWHKGQRSHDLGNYAKVVILWPVSDDVEKK